MAPKSNKNDKCHDCGKDVITNEKALSCSWWFSPGALVSSTNKNDMTEILLKVALNTIIYT
jgi:hypothetical protein